MSFFTGYFVRKVGHGHYYAGYFHCLCICCSCGLRISSAVQEKGLERFLG